MLFCTPLHFMELVEPVIESDISDEADLFLKRGFCQAHIPVPLGENRERFLRLVDDIKNRKEHYAEQFNALTDLGATHMRSQHPDLKNEVVSSLLREHGFECTFTKTEQGLWQARLILAIAEILDSEEKVLREELSFLKEEEIAFIRSFKSERDSNEEYLLDELEKTRRLLEKPRPRDIINRFESWLRLMQNQPLPSIKLWLASTRESADQIFKRYKATGSGTVVPLLKLTLPAHIMASGKYVVQQIETFQKATTIIHQGLVADLERIVSIMPYIPGSPESLLPFGTDWAEQWEAALDEYFPPSRDGRSSITIYLLPEQPVAKLLSIPETSDTMQAQNAHGLLGILEN